MGFHFRKSVMVAPVESVGGSLTKTRNRKTYSLRTYKVCGVILIALAVLAFFIGLPTLLVGGWIFIAIGVFALVYGVLFLRKAKEPKV